MQQVIMAVGLPASGKSTWAKQWVKEKPEERKRVNRDDLRAMLDVGDWSPENERFIVKVRDSLILQAIRSGKSIVVDDTNLRADNFTKVCNLISGAGLTAIVMEKPFPIEVDEAVKRDAERASKGGVTVGEKVIRDMWKKYIGKHGSLAKPRTQQITSDVVGLVLEHVEGAPSIVICDLDGTLALMGDRSPYDASHCDEIDLPNTPVIECVKAMYAKGCQVIFMSGREEKDREPSQRFIEKFCRTPVTWAFPQDPETRVSELAIPYQLFMRETADQRKDSIVKRELFDTHVRGKYNVMFVLDDRKQVVDMWRHELGLTVLQCAEGNF